MTFRMASIISVGNAISKGKDGMRNRVLSLTIAFCIIASTLTMVAYSQDNTSGFTDINPHWAGELIKKWSGYGVLKGTNGLFRPNDPITRAELATVINRVIGYKVGGDVGFKDVDTDAWYYEDIMKLSTAGVIRGSDGYVRPDDNVTREEAVVMLARAFGITDGAHYSNRFDDTDDISDWASIYVNCMSGLGYIKGSNNLFRPRENITRSETIAVLDNIIPAFYNLDGDFSSNTSGNVAIRTGGIILRDASIEGDIYVMEGAGGGALELHGCFADTVYLRGSDMEISISDSAFNEIVLEPDISVTINGKEYSNGSVERMTIKPESFAEAPEPVPVTPAPTPEPTPEIPAKEPDGTKNNPFNITCEDDFEKIRTDSDWGKGKHYILKDDITLSDWTPLSFDGRFDGGGHTITIESLKKDIESAGLFGSLGDTAVVNNLVVNISVSVSFTDDVYTEIEGYGTWRGFMYIGGIAGRNSGSINDCAVIGNIAVICKPSHFGSETRADVGGIAGDNRGNISNCYFSGSIQALSSQTSHTGGITGSNFSGGIHNSFSMGSITDSAVNGSAGGITGSNMGFPANESVINNCFATGSVASSNGYCGGIVGYYLAHGSNIYRCIALNISISGGDGIGRIAGNWDGSAIVDNYAIDTIAMSYVPISNKNSKDGETVSITSLSKKFFANTLGYPFADSADSGSTNMPWIWNDRSRYTLPVLWFQDLTTIPTEMPDHLR